MHHYRSLLQYYGVINTAHHSRDCFPQVITMSPNSTSQPKLVFTFTRNWLHQVRQVPQGDRCYYWHANIIKHKFNWLQGQNHSFSLFAEISPKEFFQFPSQVQNTKYISQQPEVAFRYKFNYSLIITFTKKNKTRISPQRFRVTEISAA